ncbi:E3 ubiquitin-protein ligase TRIM50-like [Strongylocentrotus purpuratus]|uniref:Uncharacterized protein n=1 Tax=Strongylocentrotus purpuratus TaxID=7668 RepID=A0A7M7GGA5_STRPU|nr:E3 ubiquitin-protein ligase TRIM50-like [Strongylocentrotus purpuratus]|eukprot:XP_003725189.1 PREDICTED: E3 ubiquitin-protein ligase TRIM50-like [Strongylocentrotus purpuratus]
MAKRIALQMPESLACPLCLDAFKVPTLLFCGHTFCKVCLDKYDTHYRGQDFMECPVCKKRTKLEKNRVAGLAPNFSVKGLEEELHVHPRANGKSSEYCSLHSKVYKDILCEVCKEFICLSCLFDKHQGHRFKKKEEVVAELKKKRKSLIKRSEKKKAEIKVSIANRERHMRDMHSHLENLDREIENSFHEKSEILRGHRERLSKELDDIRQKSDKAMTDLIGRQKHSLQRITSKSTLIRREGVASTSTCKFPNSDALKTLYIEFLELENELDRDLNETSAALAKHKVENTQLYTYDESVCDLGTFHREASGNESESESDQHDMADLARIRKTFKYIANLSIPTELR